MNAPPACRPSWMLPLLLLHLWLSFHLLVSVPIPAMTEFGENMKAFGAKVEHCPEDCGAASIGSCPCFNFSVSPQECGFPTYFIKGLNSLHSNISRQLDISSLLELIEDIGQMNRINFTFCPGGDSRMTPPMSPKSFHRELESVMQQLNSLGR